MSKETAQVYITRTAADGTGLGSQVISAEKGVQCTTHDGARGNLLPSILLGALAEVPDSLGLADRAVHSVDCTDPGVPPI